MLGQSRNLRRPYTQFYFIKKSIFTLNYVQLRKKSNLSTFDKNNKYNIMYNTIYINSLFNTEYLCRFMKDTFL